MVDEHVVIMDGPGPFFFGRLQGPIEILPAPGAGAVAIQGQMEVNETGRKVVVRMPMANADAFELLRLLEDYWKAKPRPEPQ